MANKGVILGGVLLGAVTVLLTGSAVRMFDYASEKTTDELLEIGSQ